MVITTHEIRIDHLLIYIYIIERYVRQIWSDDPNKEKSTKKQPFRNSTIFGRQKLHISIFI